MSAYIRSHNTMPKEGFNSVAKIMHAVGELTVTVAELADGEHHGSTTSDAEPKQKRTPQQKAEHKEMIERKATARKNFQDGWMKANKSPEEISAFHDELVSLQEVQRKTNTDNKVTLKGKEKEEARKKAFVMYVRSIQALLTKYGVPKMAGESAPTSGGGVMGTSDMEAQFDHDLWMQRPLGYEMRDSLRYL
jgi:hypothetical protein